MGEWYMHVNSGDCRGQRKASDLCEPKVEAVVSSLMWVLGIKLREVLRKKACALNH